MLKLPLQRTCSLHSQLSRLRRHHFKQGNITLATLMIFPLPQSPHLIIQPFYDVMPNATHDSSASPPTNPCLLKLRRYRLRTKAYLRWAQTSNPRTHARTHLQASHGNESTKVEVATTVMAVVVAGRLMQHSSFSYARTAKHKREQRMPQMLLLVLLLRAITTIASPLSSYLSPSVSYLQSWPPSVSLTSSIVVGDGSPFWFSQGLFMLTHQVLLLE